MTQNSAFKYLQIGLPEDIRRYQQAGYFTKAIELINAKLTQDNISFPLKQSLLAHKEMFRRQPWDYPYDKSAALALIREHIKDFTEEEFDQRQDRGEINWIYVNGQPHYLDRFFASLCKTDSAFAKRANVIPIGADGAGERLDSAIENMKTNGKLAQRIRAKISIQMKPEVFQKGQKVRAYLPIPAATAMQSAIEIENVSPKPTTISSEDSDQRVVFWEETMTENHPFFVEFSYTSTATYLTLDSAKVAAKQPDFFLEEKAPHILFTPYIKSLVQEICGKETNPLEKARKIYDFITLNVKYSFMPAYFSMEDIAGNCARNLCGDCGVQALLFITLCRCAGIPARWQSGWKAEVEFCGSHDWAQFYVAPFGWLYADPSFGGGAVREHNEARRKHYFGNLDPYRMVANTKFQGDFSVPKEFWRCDPYDNQTGEMETDKGALTYNDVIRTREVTESKKL